MPGAGSHLAQHGHDGLVVFGWGSGADTTAPSMPHCRRSLYRTVQHARTHSPFPPRKRLFGPWLGRRQPCLLDPQSLPKHRLSRDIPVAHCEHQPRPHGCPERHQWHGPVAVGADVALRLCTPNGPPAAESCGPPPAPCHGTQPRGVTSPWRMASPHRGAWHHPAMAHSHTALARGATSGSPALGWGKGAWGHPSGVPVSLAAMGTRVPGAGDRRDSRAPWPFSTAARRTLRAQPRHTASERSTDPSSPQKPPDWGRTLPIHPKGLTGAGWGRQQGGLLAPRPGGGSQARSELPRADARCLCERAHILQIPGSRPEIPQSYISHIWFQLGSGEGEPLTNPGRLFGGGYFPRPEGMCAKL